MPEIKKLRHMYKRGDYLALAKESKLSFVPDLVERMIERRVSVVLLETIAENPSLADMPEVAERLLGNSQTEFWTFEWTIRARMASNLNIARFPTAIIKRLADDDEPMVQAALAKNPELATLLESNRPGLSKIIESFIRDSNDLVATSIAGNRAIDRFPEDIVNELSKRPSYGVRYALVENPSAKCWLSETPAPNKPVTSIEKPPGRLRRIG